eukprot:TRINITY_DN3719_c0_g1_i1.p1 TRINITY_DN3719_c0_g1~~TRINITY_DN3719_c0_g1_i1.p1  ORF type:complete len:136 (-),score=21.71 TRINITY_DN3719_c0_g1_i1:110-517(-)
MRNVRSLAEQFGSTMGKTFPPLITEFDYIFEKKSLSELKAEDPSDLVADLKLQLEKSQQENTLLRKANTALKEELEELRSQLVEHKKPKDKKRVGGLLGLIKKKDKRDTDTDKKPEETDEAKTTSEKSDPKGDLQ